MKYRMLKNNEITKAGDQIIGDHKKNPKNMPEDWTPAWNLGRPVINYFGMIVRRPVITKKVKKCPHCGERPVKTYNPTRFEDIMAELATDNADDLHVDIRIPRQSDELYEVLREVVRGTAGTNNLLAAAWGRTA
jgi:hypothetical protein